MIYISRFHDSGILLKFLLQESFHTGANAGEKDRLETENSTLHADKK